MKRFWTLAVMMFMILSSSDSFSQNKLTPAESKAGWKLLFDGTSTKGWHVYNKSSNGAAWKIADGELYLDASAKEGRGDLVTDSEYENYELTLEWKVSACANSGILFNVVEDAKYAHVYLTGPEMQVLDNSCHPDAKINKHRAGDLYDLIACSTETVKPAGEWNEVKIISKNSHYEFWLNGTKVVTFTMHDAAWDEMVKNSKFKSMPDFGKAKKGHIALQDHGDKVSFRNIRIRELK
ncbi:3-keto-disaccharide hydrolase [Ohtaekwangia sp.]|uniref:3-keto-disaccharide hydrolase n=1 Tax=Ohtaekwangia sp. TaxID=2066019 RepID=UPI002F95E5B5